MPEINNNNNYNIWSKQLSQAWGNQDLSKDHYDYRKYYNDPNIEYEINEDFLIPLNMKRNRVPLKGITGNMLRDSRLTIPELYPNIFRIAVPIGMSLPFLNNSQK